jgi:hypothetical protein
MVLNDASSIDATSGSAVILDRMGPIARVCGTKQEIAARIWAEIDQRFLAAKRP